MALDMAVEPYAREYDEDHDEEEEVQVEAPKVIGDECCDDVDRIHVVWCAACLVVRRRRRGTSGGRMGSRPHDLTPSYCQS